LNMVLTFDQRNLLKTRRGGRGPNLTLCETASPERGAVQRPRF
jgi:hypothetical protein